MVLEYLTAILVFVTAIYAYLTHKMAKASEASVQAVRDQSEAMLRPYIGISPFVRPQTTVLYLRIENTGRSAAENVRLTMDRDFFQFGESKQKDKNLRTKSAFTQPINSFSAGNKLIFALAQGFVIFGESGGSEATPHEFNITAEYEYNGKHAKDLHRIDLRPYIGSEGERNAMADELEKIRQVLEKRDA